jgi:energy-converting hydrogenase Eha subunit G
LYFLTQFFGYFISLLKVIETKPFAEMIILLIYGAVLSSKGTTGSATETGTFFFGMFLFFFGFGTIIGLKVEGMLEVFGFSSSIGCFCCDVGCSTVGS